MRDKTNYLWENIDFVGLVQLYDECPKDIYKEFIDQQITLNEYTKWLSTQPKIDLGLGIPSAGDASEKGGINEEKKPAAKEEIKVI